MKKFVILALILVLTLSLFAGCRRNSADETATPSGSQSTDGIGGMDPSDGAATDDNGVIGDEARSNIGRMPMHR